MTPPESQACRSRRYSSDICVFNLGPFVYEVPFELQRPGWPCHNGTRGSIPRLREPHGRPLDARAKHVSPESAQVTKVSHGFSFSKCLSQITWTARRRAGRQVGAMRRLCASAESGTITFFVCLTCSFTATACVRLAESLPPGTPPEPQVVE